jgi:hypothetical protein
MNSYRIQEFFGIQQQTDGTLLPATSAADARNIDTSDGNLSVAKGYVKYIATILPDTERVLKLIVARGATVKWYVVTAKKIYVWASPTWTTVYTFSTTLTTTQIDYVQTQIGTDDYLIIATGETQMIKVKISTDAAEAFGTGEYSYSGTVSSYNSGTKTVTLSGTLSAEAIRHAPLDGITINGTWHAVESATSTTVVLVDDPDPDPASPNAATIRGGGSNFSCNFCDMYFGRFFSCGDPTNPSRLYWSAVSGDGRTIEDWLSVEGSADASGGYVEIGDNGGDAIIGMTILSDRLMIFKRYSVYYLRGDRPSNYAVERVENFSERMSNASVVVKNNLPYYLTASGIQVYDGTGIVPINEGVRYLNSFFQTINSALQSKGVYAQNVFYFSCKVNSTAIYDDTIIVFDIARASYMIRNGFEIADMTVHDGIVYLINGSRYVYQFNSGTDYDGTAIDAYWITQKTDLSAKGVEKQISKVMFRADSGRLVLTLYGDGIVRDEIDRPLSDDKGGFVSIPVKFTKSRTIQMKIGNKAGSSFSIEGGIEATFLDETR